MKSPVVKRSVVLAVSLEDAFWQGLKDIATSRRTTLSDLINSIDIDRERSNLSSALRLFVLSHYQAGQPNLGSEHRPVSKRVNSSITRR